MDDCRNLSRTTRECTSNVPLFPRTRQMLSGKVEGHDHVPSVLQAALSGPNSKASGSAGGYLLRAGWLARSQPSVRGPSSATSARRVLAEPLPKQPLLFQLPHP